MTDDVSGVPPHPVSRLVVWLAAACALLAASVFLQRGVATVQAVATLPGVAVTSGFEEESFFALWRASHHQAIYVDSTRIPYASAYFNWLFYDAYTVPVRWATARYNDAIIPLAGRSVTFLIALVGCIVLIRWWGRAMSQVAPAAALATFVFFGPLVGWWSFSVRPDVGALTCEAAALMVLLSGYRTRETLATVGSCALFFAAWSFKQTYGLGLGAGICFLLVRRRWRAAALLVVATVALWTLTIALLGPAYRAAFLATGTTNVFYMSFGFRNLSDFLRKSSPLWLFLVLLASDRRTSDRPTAHLDDLRLLGWLGLAIALPLGFVVSCKIGAFSNYFFTAQLMLACLLAGMIGASAAPRRLLAGFGALTALHAAFWCGWTGQKNLRPQADELAATWAVWQDAAEPRFSCVNTLNEPWLNPNSTPFVIAFNYDQDRMAHRPFERGGIGGLIADGYFHSLLLPADVADSYDGGSLSRYTRSSIHGQLALFERTVPPRPAPTTP